MVKNGLSFGVLPTKMMAGAIMISSHSFTQESSSCYYCPQHIYFSLLGLLDINSSRILQMLLEIDNHKEEACFTKGKPAYPHLQFYCKTACKASHLGLDQKRWRRCIFVKKLVSNHRYDLQHMVNLRVQRTSHPHSNTS